MNHRIKSPSGVIEYLYPLWSSIQKEICARGEGDDDFFCFLEAERIIGDAICEARPSTTIEEDMQLDVLVTNDMIALPAKERARIHDRICAAFGVN